MSTLAAFLKERNRKILEAMSPEERVRLAWDLGERDLEIYRCRFRLTRREALARLRRQRQQGRRPSHCLREETP